VSTGYHDFCFMFVFCRMTKLSTRDVATGPASDHLGVVEEVAGGIPSLPVGVFIKSSAWPMVQPLPPTMTVTVIERRTGRLKHP
jgi:hypothetical protein